MDIKKEDFPIYAIMEASNKANLGILRTTFNNAVSGDLNEQYRLALNLQAMVMMPGASDILPAMTPAIKQKTLESCLKVFDDLSEKGIDGAAMMSAYFHGAGLGCKPDAVQAKVHFDRAVEINPKHREFVRAWLGENKLAFVESGTPFPADNSFGFF